jgi:hypothetical protein
MTIKRAETTVGGVDDGTRATENKTKFNIANPKSKLGLAKLTLLRQRRDVV